MESPAAAPAKAPLVYTWAQVVADKHLVQQLRDIYGGPDRSSKAAASQPMTPMPWVVRALLGDHLCPHLDSADDPFPFPNTAEQDDALTPTEILTNHLNPLAEFLQPHSRGRNGPLVAQWVEHVGADPKGSYYEISRVYSAEKELVRAWFPSPELASQAAPVAVSPQPPPQPLQLQSPPQPPALPVSSAQAGRRLRKRQTVTPEDALEEALRSRSIPARAKVQSPQEPVVPSKRQRALRVRYPEEIVVGGQHAAV
jgi:hypothetical protein